MGITVRKRVSGYDNFVLFLLVSNLHSCTHFPPPVLRDNRENTEKGSVGLAKVHGCIQARYWHSEDVRKNILSSISPIMNTGFPPIMKGSNSLYSTCVPLCVRGNRVLADEFS